MIPSPHPVRHARAAWLALALAAAAVSAGWGLSPLALSEAAAAADDAPRSEARAAAAPPAPAIPRSAAPPAIESPVPAPLPTPPPEAEAGSPIGALLLARLRAIEASARVTRYVHVMRVDEEAGSYLWDCSGMVSWLLRHESRRHFDALGSRRPFARDFAHLVQRSSTLYPRSGWRRVLRLEDARAGDVFSWHHETSLMATGHVGFLVSTPTPVEGREGLFSVRVADATKEPHSDDTRAEDTDGGLGEGTMTFAVDSMGRGRSYGWTLDDDQERTRIWIGRLE